MAQSTSRMVPIMMDFSQQEEDAFALTRAALAISRAQSLGLKDELETALDQNLQLWVAIRTMVERRENPLPPEVKENLLRLSRFVCEKTFEQQIEPKEVTLNALTNANLQIAEGLLESLDKARETVN